MALVFNLIFTFHIFYVSNISLAVTSQTIYIYIYMYKEFLQFCLPSSGSVELRNELYFILCKFQGHG